MKELTARQGGSKRMQRNASTWRTRLAGATGCVLAVVLVAACASLDPNNPGFLAGEMSEAQEQRIGARENPKVLAAFGGAYEPAQISRYVNRVTTRLAENAASGRDGYRVTVLNSPSINAFSLPGGFIYVTRGLLALANNEAELAAVIAHEIAHIDSRHALQREQQVTSAASIGRVTADIMRGPGASAEALSFARNQLAKFSRQQELEADAIGIRLMAKTGYDPRAAVSFLRSLSRQTQLHSRRLNRIHDPNRVDLTATHPTTPERISAAEQDARALTPADGGRRDAAAHLAAIDGVLYGDDPREGFVRGRTFLHPRLGITFSVPDGYGLQNAPNAVVGFAPDGAIVRFDGIEISRRASLVRYLERNAVRGGEVREVSEGRVNGRDAGFAVASADRWIFRIALIRGRDRMVYRFIHATQKPGSNDAAAFMQTVNTFRFVSEQEAQSIRPLRIRVDQVRPGDTSVSLARRMAQPDMQLERFLTLNGIRAGQALQPGQQVKLIGE